MTSDQHRSLQPMTISDIFSRSMHLYQENFLKLVTIVAPGAVAELIIFHLIVGNRYEDIRSPDRLKEPEVMGALLLYAVMALFLSSIVTAAGTIVISERFLNREMTIGQAYLRVLDSLFPLVGALICFAISVFIGFMLFLIPGIIAYVWFCLTAPVVMIEGEGGLGALKRSRVIIKGYFGKTFLVVASLAIIQIVVTMTLPNLIGRLSNVYILVSLFSNTLALLIEPFKIAATTMLYYDLRIRKEGYTLHIMAEELSDLP
ncbi:hypothetical protein HYR99_29870 [Candidatus Poribacteria bacterium]|nr:hypothetical protein [Candidatus Poribacteria bacterium]